VQRGARPEPLTDLPYRNEAGSISPDGSELFFHARRDVPNPDLAVLNTETLEVRFLLETEYADQHPAISPDGRLLAYQSGRTGTDEIWVRPYPEVEAGAWQVSKRGGLGPTWGDDCGEIFYWSYDRGQMLSVRIETDPEFSVSEPDVLFSAGDLQQSGTGYYHRSDRKFLFATKTFQENEFRRELRIIRNWPALLER
jgi:hypothetical protein